MEQDQAGSMESALRRHDFTENLSDAQVAKLASFASAQTFHADERVLKAGDRADRCYLIQEGQIAVEVYHPTRGGVPIQTVGEGKVLGWSWLVKPYRWAFDAMTYTFTRAIVLDGVRLREAMEADPEFGYPVLMQFMEVCAERISNSRLQMIDMFDPH
ncbi:MAG: cyclic nucleotide-binding domain-containing protein [Candidatus Hydrogenedentota bacterium]